MEHHEFLNLFSKFINGNIKRDELNRFREYIGKILYKSGITKGENMINNLIDSFNKDEKYEDIISEFLTFLLAKKSILEKILENALSDQNEGLLRSYINKMARNFLIDKTRIKKAKELYILDITKNENAKNISEDSIISFLSKEKLEEQIEKIELSYIDEKFKEFFKEDELKYLCYIMISKDYKNLWKDKSDEAIYKDISRKKSMIINKLKSFAENMGISKDQLAEYTKIYLSAHCEKLRNKYNSIGG